MFKIESRLTSIYHRSEPDNGHKQVTDTYHPDFCNYQERLNSYRSWKSTFPYEQLAKAGFYYKGFSDVVKCPFCNVEGHNWVEGDIPMEDHAKWSPNCPFVRESSNSSTEQDNIPTEVTNNRTGDTCGKFGIEIYPNSVPENECNRLTGLGIPKAKPPSNPKYITLEQRKESFINWPKALKQKPADLAEAGFYYVGTGDQTKCFHCGGGLKDWEENDDPFEQHALWFSKCNYLYLKKGSEYIESVIKSKKLPAEVPAQEPSTSASTSKAKDESSKESEGKEASVTLCKICFKNELGVVFIPCGHIVACVDCAAAINECAVCRKRVEAKFRSFLS